MSSKPSFFDSITKLIGFDPKIDTGIFDPMPDEPQSKKYPRPLLEKDEHDNVRFNIQNIHGQIYVQDVSGARSKQNNQPVQIIRYKDPGDRGKYMPALTGQGVFPWISAELVKAFKEKKKVKRLILTEGYKKAFVCCKQGLYAFGLPGITVWKAKEQKEIFKDIQLFVETCQVEEVLWLTDADTFDVHWEPNKDLFKRPNLFCSSVFSFKTLCRDWKIDLWFAHIVTDSKQKGIDDLFIEKSEAKEKIKKELNHSSGTTNFIVRYNISTWAYFKIQELFAIHNNALTFYEKYGSNIGLEEFVYRNGVYVFDTDKNDLIYKKSGEAAQFIRVMKDYYMLASMPTTTSFVKNTRIHTDKGSIQEKFKNRSKKEVDKILHDIEFYDGFFSEPGHLDYRRSIKTVSEEGHETLWYNKYMPLTHKIIKGKIITPEDIPISLSFVSHIFGTGSVHYKGKDYLETDIGLDYIQLLFMKPKQLLPILSLLSPENQTGKTKFWQWMVAIFQQNAKMIPPEMLTGNFTEYFINSLLVIIDEALLNKIETMNRVKAMTTYEDTMVNGKHAKEIETQTFIKVGLSSNSVKDFANLTKHDQRFWLRDVPVIPAEKYIPDFFEKITAEIPAFLTFLTQRKLVTENEDRFWIAPELRKTTALDRVISNSRPGNEILIETTIKNYMTLSGKPFVKLGLFDIQSLSQEKNTLSLTYIRWVLETKWDKVPIGYSRKYVFYRTNVSESMEGADSVSEVIQKTNYYTFSATEFFTPAQVLELFDVSEIIYAEKDKAFKLKEMLSFSDYLKVKKSIDPNSPDIPHLQTVWDRCSTYDEWADELSKYVSAPKEKMPF